MKHILVGGIILSVMLTALLGVGYVVNIVKFAKLDFQEPYKAEVIRGVGVVTGLGGIIGYIKIQD